MSLNIPEQYQTQYEENKKEVLSLYELDEKWKLHSDKEGVTIHQRIYKDNDVLMIRVESTFDASIEETADLLFNNPDELMKSKPLVKSAEILEEFEEKGRVILVATKPVLFVSSREVLVYSKDEKYQNGMIQIQVGLETHPKAPITSSAVRTTTVLGGYILLPSQDDETKTKVVYVILNLLNGYIPVMLQGTVCSQHLNSFVYFKKFFLDKKKQSKQDKKQEKQEIKQEDKQEEKQVDKSESKQEDKQVEEAEVNKKEIKEDSLENKQEVKQEENQEAKQEEKKGEDTQEKQEEKEEEVMQMNKQEEKQDGKQEEVQEDKKEE